MVGTRVMVASTVVALAAAGTGAALAATHGGSSAKPATHSSKVGKQQAPQRMRGVRCHHDDAMMSTASAGL
jgi:hypothetical protein